jgi:hypothetical protein
MRYESYDLPHDGNLVPLLREVATHGVNERSDAGDFSSWDWVCRLYADHPEWRDSVDDAFATLLTAEDPMPKRVLDQVTKLPVRSFLPRLYDAITGRCAELAARKDSTRTDDRSVLGSIVHAASSTQKPVRPSRTLAHELASMSRREDGWPNTFLLALPADVQAFLPRVISVLQGLDEPAFKDFVQGMVVDGPPWTDIVFEEIGRGPPDVRNRVASVVRSWTEEAERERSTLASMSFPDNPALEALVRAAAAKKDPWPDYAARLGVAESS